MINFDKIQEAFNLVRDGKARRIDIDGQITVYRAGTIIRIDIKVEE